MLASSSSSLKGRVLMTLGVQPHWRHLAGHGTRRFDGIPPRPIIYTGDPLALLHLCAREPGAEKLNNTAVVAECKDLIARGIDIDATDREGKNALILASANGHTELVELLILLQAALDVQDGVGRTAVIYCARLNRIEACRLLCIGAGARVETKDRWGKSALVYAKEWNRKGIIAILGAAQQEEERRKKKKEKKRQAKLERQQQKRRQREMGQREEEQYMQRQAWQRELQEREQEKDAGEEKEGEDEDEDEDEEEGVREISAEPPASAAAPAAAAAKQVVPACGARSWRKYRAPYLYS